MKKVLIGVVALASAVAFAQAADQKTKFVPHVAAGAARVAFQEVSDAPCAQSRSILACVVQLGPDGNNDRWAYFLDDPDGRPSTDVKAESRVVGASCAGMAYPVGNVTIAGGMGDWFAGKVQRACRP